MEASRYQANWESYWSKLFEDRDLAFWDVASDLTLAEVLPRLQNFFEPTLPLIDFGCGNGTQAFFLAKHFSTVIGVDVAEAAIKQAQFNNSSDNLSFEMLDGTNPQMVRAFHSKVGDVNVYLRGILHQIRPEDRPLIIESLQTLMGNTGRLYLCELSPQAKVLFKDLARQIGAPPAQLARVYQHGIEPADIQPEEIRASFPSEKYTISDEGKTSITTNYILPDGDRLQMPAFYMLINQDLNI